MTVRRVEVAEATESLATYIRKAAGSGPGAVTDEGKPVAALVTLEDTDLKTVALSTDPEFLELIQRSRARHAQEGGLSSAEVRRRLGAWKLSRPLLAGPDNAPQTWRGRETDTFCGR